MPAKAISRPGQRSNRLGELSRSTESEYDVLVIGAGFAGMYALHTLRQRGYSVRVFERGPEVGGTWYWNRYPGARCDVPSLDYCYIFSKSLYGSWEWTERYATQPEILDYARHVADQLDLRRDISFKTQVVGGSFDDEGHMWQLTLGDSSTVRGRFCVTAVGCLSAVNAPDLPGNSEFRGQIVHSAEWPEGGLDIASKRVGVVGTGSSGVQLIPELAKAAEHLVVFQRTPNYSFPARNRPLSGREQWLASVTYDVVAQHAQSSVAGLYIPSTGKSALTVATDEREATFEHAWSIGGTDILAAFTDTLIDINANAFLAEFVARKISQTVVDPERARRLTPHDQPVGAKRPCVDSGYYETFNAPHVELVDLRSEPLVGFTPTGLRSTARDYDLDVVVMATGFDAITGPLTRLGLVGTDGLTLAERWAAGPSSYLGVAMHRYPNLFTITGPGSPSVFVNVVRAAEQHVEWIADVLDYLKNRGAARIEASAQAQKAWDSDVAEAAEHTVHRYADSWYFGSNVSGKPRKFLPYLGGLPRYRQLCREVAESGYAGFDVTEGLPHDR
jgi:cation diffusion facilitator CzcD-associated flavoprotein CzcO